MLSLMSYSFLSEFSMDILNKDLVSQNEAQNPLMSSLFLFLIE